MAVNAMTYIKNVGKSFGYAAVDFFNEKNPSVKAIMDTTKDLSSELYENVKDFKEKVKNIKSGDEDSFLSEPIGLVKDFYTNLISDIQTGNWYNKERKNKDEEEMANNFFGDDWDNFDFDDNFDVDDDFDSSSKSKSSSDDFDDDFGDLDFDDIDTVGQKVSECVSMATAKSAHYIVSSSKQNTKAMIDQNNRLFYQVNNGLAAINSNISSLVKLGTDINTHIQNSAVFFTKSTELQTKQVELLESIVKNTAPMQKQETNTGSKYKRFTDILGDNDILDLKEYIEAVRYNIKNEISFITGMSDMFKDENGKGDSIFKTFISSPLEEVMKGAIGFIVPKMLQDTMETFNNSLSGFFGSLILNLNKASSSNPIFDGLLRMLGIRNSLKNTLDTSLYEKGKVDFDGITRKSIVEVIPTYLSKILSAVSGKEEMRFDYKDGLFKTASKIKQERDDITKSAARSAGYDLLDEFREIIKEGYTDKEKEDMMNQVTNFLVKSVEKGEKFNYRQRHKIDKEKLKSFGLDEKVGDMLLNLLEDLEADDKGYIALNLNKEIGLARDKISDTYRSIENSGDSILTSLYNGSMDEKQLTSVSPFNLNNIYDDKHNNIFYYLQGIYKFTRHMSDNIGIGGGSNSNGKGYKGGAYKRIKEIEDNTPVKSETPAREEYTEYKYNELIYNINEELMEDKSIKSYSEYMNLSENEREKYIAKLIEAKRKTKETKDKIKEIKETANDQISKIVGGITKIFNKPVEFVSDILKKANKSMLDIIYGEKGKEDEGFLGFIMTKTKSLFSKFEKWIDENIMDRFDLPHIKEYIDDFFGEKGPDGKRHGGKLGKIGSQIADNFSKAGDWIRDSASNFVGGVRDFVTGDFKYNAYTGGNVEKTGLVAVSEGEMIVPSEFNPFYKGKTDKKKQAEEEDKVVEGFFGKFKDGTPEGSIKAEKEDNTEKESTLDKVGKQIKKGMSKFMGTKENPGFGRKMAKTGIDGLSRLYDEVFAATTEDEKKKREKFRSTMGTVMEEMGVPENISSSITGGLIGGGLSLLSGGIISPLLGAAAGAGVGLITNSKTVQEALFGTEEKEGLLPENVANFVQKNFPQMAQFGTIGGLAGLLGIAPGGPVGGLILGATLGYVTKSEKVHEFLFGTDTKEGFISKDFQKKVKEAAPNIALGALGGLVAGPFGLVGNIMVGSAIGYATSTEDFKDKLFGEDGIIKTIKEKVIKPLTDAITSIAYEFKFQIKSFFKSTTRMLHNMFKEIIIIPLKKAMKDVLLKPMGKVLKALAIPVLGLGAIPFKGLTMLGSKLKENQIKKGKASYMTAKQRLNYRSDKNLGTDDETYKFDEKIVSMDSDDLRKFRSYLQAVQNPDKDLQKKATNSLNDISSRLSMDDRLSTKEIWKITNAIKSGDADKAMRSFDKYMEKRGISKEDAKSLRENVLKDIDRFNDYKFKQSDINKYTQEKIDEINKLYGTNITQKNAWKYEDLLKTEIKSKDKIDENTPEGRILAQEKVQHKELISKLDEIIKVLNPNRKNKGSEPVSEEEKKKYKEVEEKVKNINNSSEVSNINMLTGNVIDNIRGFGVGESYIDKLTGVQRDDSDIYATNFDRFELDQIPEDILNGRKQGRMTFEELLQRNKEIKEQNKKLEEERKSNFRKNLNINYGSNKNPEFMENNGNSSLIPLAPLNTSDTNIIQNLPSVEALANSVKNNIAGLDNAPNNLNKNNEVQYATTSTGELIKHRLNPQGEPEVDNRDQNTRNIMSKQKEVQEAHISTSKSLGGLGGTISSLFSKFFGNNEDKKEGGILKTIKEKLESAWHTIVTFVTGGGLLKLIQDILTLGAAGATVSALTGGKKGKKVQEAADKGLQVITGGTNDPDNSEGGYFYDKRTKSIDINGKTYKIQVDENGNPIKDANGNYIQANGNVIYGSNGQWVTEEKAGRTLQSRMIEGEIRGVVGGKLIKDSATGKVKGFKTRPTVVSTVAKKVKNSRVGKLVSKGIKKAVGDDVAEVAANEGVYKGFMKMLSNTLEKIPVIFNRIPFLRRFADNVDEMVTALYTHLDDAAIRLGERLGSLASSLSSALVVLKIAFIVADFYTGYQDARSTLGIVETPTESQRLISGLIRMIKNLIPVIGALIPDKALVDLFVNRLAPILGIDTTDIQRQRDEARETVKAYNKKHKTDYTIEEYNKKVLKDYTITEKAGNLVRSIKSNIKEKGFVGAVKSGAQEYVENAKETFDKNYEEGGIIPAIAETLDSLLPGYIGDGVKGVVYMGDLALKGKVKEVLTYSPVEDKNASMLTKVFGQLTVAVPKLGLVPAALISSGVQKLIEILGIEEQVKSLGNFIIDIGNMGKYALTGELSKMSAVGKDNGNDDQGFTRVAKKIGTFIPKMTLMPLALLTTGIKKLLEALNLDELDKLSSFGSDIINMGKYAFTGEWTRFENSTNTALDNDSSFAYKGKNIVLNILKVLMSPIAGLTTGVKATGMYMWDGIKKVASAIKMITVDNIDIYKYALTGEFNKMVTVGLSGDQTLLENILRAIPTLLTKLHMLPVAGLTTSMKWIGNKIGDALGKFNKVADTDNVIDELLKAKTYKDIWNTKPTLDKDNPYIGYNKAVLTIHKVFRTIHLSIEKISEGISELVNGIVDYVKDAWGTVEKFVSDPIGYLKEQYSKISGEELSDYLQDDYDKNGFFKTWFNIITGKGSGIKDYKKYVGGSSGFVSQNDPQYSNVKYGSGNVGEEGCGPAVATMAVNNALGQNISMKDSLSYARKKKYETENGTSADYFGDMFNNYGLESEYTRNLNGNKSKDIEDKLASGSNVVLLGQDKQNTSKSNSPFGPNNHYVLATGMDDKGNVIVNDPEMNQPTVYNKKILDNTNLAISAQNNVASGSSIGTKIIRKVNRRFNIYTGGAASNERIIFNFLTDKKNGLGLNTAAACGILANIQKESSFNPNAEGDHGTSYGICQWHNERYDSLKKWCSSKGYDYKTLNGQLRYLEYELTTGYKGMLAKFKKASDTAQGAYSAGYTWCYDFERPKNRSSKSVERGNLAKNTYYPKYKGQKGTYDQKAASESNDNHSDTDTSSNTNNSSEDTNQTGISKLTSLFGGLMGSFYGTDNPVAKLLGFSSTSSSDSSSKGNDSLTTYEGVSEGGPGNDKQKKLVEMMKSKLGKLNYSWEIRNPDRGAADCSSTVNWAYKKVFNKDIGNSTPAILSDNDTGIVYIDPTANEVSGTTTSKGPDESKLQPGDILLYSRPTSSYTAGRKYRVGHVEMYAGDGKRIGHGGPNWSDKGPKLTDLNRNAKNFIMAKRLKDVGSGSGIYDSRNYINTVHQPGTIMNINRKSNINNEQEIMLKDKAKTAIKTISGKGVSSSDETMISLVKSIVTILTTMANNSSKINTIVELLQNYFNAKNNATNNQTTKTQRSTTTRSSNINSSTELDIATKELVDYLNTLAM